MQTPSTDVASLRIDEITGLLQKVSPSSFEVLREQFPEYPMLFKLGRKLGNANNIPSVVLLRATSKSLATIVPWADTAIKICSERLGLARRLELGGSLVAMIGSGACAMFAAASGTDVVKTIATAIIAMAGNVCVAVSNYYRGSLIGGKDNLENTYTVLLQCMPELRFIESEVDELLNRDVESIATSNITKLVGRAQELCKQVYGATKQIPGAHKK